LLEATTRRMASTHEFPSDGLVPKKSTQVESFLEHNPSYDGRGVLVAILDSGVDPGAAGMQYTSDGKKKMVATFDTSGGGDVDMSKQVTGAKIDEEGCVKLTGLSKRELLLPAGIDNPSGKWRMGIKSTFQLFPDQLVRRLKAERKKVFMEKHDAVIAQAIASLASWDLKNGVSGKGSSLTREPLLERNELQARVDVLQSEKSKYEDPGPTADCVAWQTSDGSWRALVDTAGNGDLRNRRPLRTFGAYEGKDEFEYDKWDGDSQLNFALNILDDGKLLSIVTDSSGHGTHVASITAAYHPDHSEMNGVAPGAQVVSMKIGDARISGMETSSAIIRALGKCVDLGVDIINMSYGEATSLPDGGRVAQLCRELVERHGVIFVSSAGNAGPSLSTVGAPGSTSDVMIGVGAYVEPNMMLAAYGFQQGAVLPPTNYTWTSRGPAYDGYLGVTICAPGGAVASVPEWTLKGAQFMNGTSMASPNAAGGVALLVSGLKAKGVLYSPVTVKRALQATASVVPGVEVHAQGSGLMQVAKAFDALMIPHQGVHSKLSYSVYVSDSEARTNGGPARGIYIREPWEAHPAGVREYLVNVRPRFPEPVEESREHLKAIYAQRISVEKAERKLVDVKLNLRSTAPWLSCSSHVVLNSEAKTIKVAVDLSAIPTTSSGSHEVPFAYIEALDPNESPLLGPLFTLPVTVVRPEFCDGSSMQETVAPAASVARLRSAATNKQYRNVVFTPGHILRHFLVVPRGAQTIEVTLTPGDGESTVPDGSSRTFEVRMLQQSQQGKYASDEVRGNVKLLQQAGQSMSKRANVVEDGTVEVCVAQYWSSMGSGPVNIDVNFFGVAVSPERLVLGPSNAGVAKVSLRGDLAPVVVSPTGKLKSWCKSIRPDASATTIAPLPMLQRNSILGTYPPESRPTFALTLTYKFKQLEEGKVKVQLPLVDQLLYESPVDSRMCMMYDSNKKLLLVNDAWPSFETLPKGDITAKVQVRHEDKAMLDRFVDMPMVLERQLSPGFSLTFHRRLGDACSGIPSKPNRSLHYGETYTLFVAAPSWSSISKKLPKGISPGDSLNGSVDFLKKNGSKHDIEWIVMASPGSGPEAPMLKPSLQVADQDDTETITSGDESKTPTATSKANGEEKADGLTESEAIYKFVLSPAIKLKLKGLQDAKKNTVPKVADTLNQDLTDLLDSAKHLGLENSALKREINSFEIQAQLARIRMLVDLTDGALRIKPGQAPKDCDLSEIVKACDDLVTKLDVNKFMLDLMKPKEVDLDGVGKTSDDQAAAKDLQERRAWLLEALVVKVYANRFAADSEVEETLVQIAEKKDIIVSALKMDRHTYQGRFASALRILQDKFSDSTASFDSLPVSKLDAKSIHEYKCALLDQLGLDHMVTKLQEDAVMSFPADYVEF